MQSDSREQKQLNEAFLTVNCFCYRKKLFASLFRVVFSRSLHRELELICAKLNVYLSQPEQTRLRTLIKTIKYANLAQICIFIEDSAWCDLRIFSAPVPMVMTFGLGVCHEVRWRTFKIYNFVKKSLIKFLFFIWKDEKLFKLIKACPKTCINTQQPHMVSRSLKSCQFKTTNCHWSQFFLYLTMELANKGKKASRLNRFGPWW